MYKAIMVDDEIWALRGMSGIIPWEEYGFKICKLCMNVDEALFAIEEYNPDIIFTDIRMPAQSGLELVKLQKENNNDALMVIVSAYKDFNVAKEAITKGVFDYILKPLDKEEIISLVKRAKVKLDEMNQGNEDILSIDLSEEINTKKESVKKALGDLVKSPNCYVLINLSEDEVKLLQGSGKTQQIYINRFSNTYAYCGVLPYDKLLDVGISLKHDDFDNVFVMINEAILAYEANIVYSQNKTVADIQKYLLENFDKKINLGQVAEMFFISEAYLYELFKKNTNTTVVNFLKSVRMNKAKFLLKYTDCPIRDVALKVGYEDPGYFARLFRKETDSSPEVFRKDNQ